MTDIRLSPSGPVIASFGTGMRLRLADVEATMDGEIDKVIPSTNAGVINYDGFGGEAPVTVQLTNPKPGRTYRAELRLDVWNYTTNISGQLAMFIEASVDGGTNWTIVARNGHQIQSQIGADAARDGQTREVSLAFVNTIGSSIGILDTTATLKLRGRLQALTADTLAVNSLDTVAGVAGMNGNIYLLLEENTGP